MLHVLEEREKMKQGNSKPDIQITGVRLYF